jgi:hypothetical protein
MVGEHFAQWMRLHHGSPSLWISSMMYFGMLVLFRIASTLSKKTSEASIISRSLNPSSLRIVRVIVVPPSYAVFRVARVAMALVVRGAVRRRWR